MNDVVAVRNGTEQNGSLFLIFIVFSQCSGRGGRRERRVKGKFKEFEGLKAAAAMVGDATHENYSLSPLAHPLHSFFTLHFSVQHIQFMLE
jgi:hypothetical protein